MRNLWIIIVLVCPIVIACTSKKKQIERWKAEIIQTENDFSNMAADKGIAEAFLFYADDSAVLERNDVLIKGKQSIADLFEKNSSNSMKVTLSWKPDFVDVSRSGDLGYTYGKYQ